MKVAVVGIGGWGKNHLRVASLLRGEDLVDVVYAVDIDEGRLRWAEKAYGAVPVRGVENAANIDVDAAVVATPTTLHAAHASLFFPEASRRLWRSRLRQLYRRLTNC